MRNAMTQKEYNSIKKETYIFFAFKDGKRLMTYAGLNLLEAMEQQAIYQGRDRMTLIVHHSHVKDHGTANNIEDFEYLFNLGSEAIRRKI